MTKNILQKEQEDSAIDRMITEAIEAVHVGSVDIEDALMAVGTQGKKEKMESNKRVREHTIQEMVGILEGLKTKDTCDRGADCPWCDRGMYCKDRQEEIGYNDALQDIKSNLQELLK